jgi:hypothetical protein
VTGSTPPDRLRRRPDRPPRRRSNPSPAGRRSAVG